MIKKTNILPPKHIFFRVVGSSTVANSKSQLVQKYSNFIKP